MPLSPSRRKRILFACVGNSGRSQMAEAFARAIGGVELEVQSGGTRPLGHILPAVQQAMLERGLDLSSQRSRPIDEAFARSADLVVTMGCGDDCPAFLGRRVEDWPLEDPKGRTLDEVRRIRDQVEARVRDLHQRLMRQE